MAPSLLDEGLSALTSVVDGRDHLVTEDELTAADARQRGMYMALCEHLIVPASLAAPEGAACPECSTRRVQRREAARRREGANRT